VVQTRASRIVALRRNMSLKKSRERTAIGVARN